MSVRLGTYCMYVLAMTRAESVVVSADIRRQVGAISFARHIVKEEDSTAADSQSIWRWIEREERALAQLLAIQLRS